MRTKVAALVVLIIALAVVIVLISLRAYYVAVSLLIGVLLVGHRELWSLATKRRLPPFDERVRGNMGRSVRNGFIFLVLALALLMLPFSTAMVQRPDTAHLLGALLVLGGAAYLLSYLFYDRAEPHLGERRLRMLKVFLAVAVVSLAVCILSVFLHNALSGLLHIEEAVFFVIAVFVAPAAFVVGLVGSVVVLILGLLRRG